MIRQLAIGTATLLFCSVSLLAQPAAEQQRVDEQIELLKNQIREERSAIQTLQKQHDRLMRRKQKVEDRIGVRFEDAEPVDAPKRIIPMEQEQPPQGQPVDNADVRRERMQLDIELARLHKEFLMKQKAKVDEKLARLMKERLAIERQKLELEEARLELLVKERDRIRQEAHVRRAQENDKGLQKKEQDRLKSLERLRASEKKRGEAVFRSLLEESRQETASVDRELDRLLAGQKALQEKAGEVDRQLKAQKKELETMNETYHQFLTGK